MAVSYYTEEVYLKRNCMNIRKLVPHTAKPILKNALYQIYLYSPLQGPVPPEWAIFTGNGDFVKEGKRTLQLLVEQGGLQPHHRVLDVGCGMGRVALPLTTFLNSATGGHYDGFDIVKAGVDWCQQKYWRFPNFRFVHSDVHNFHYNPKGRYKASEYRFPYADDTFDVVFLNSVFTHMLPTDVENYLSEVARVLKPNGVSSITYFLVVPDAIEGMEAGRSSQGLVLKPSGHTYWARFADDPEHSTGYPKEYIEGLYKKNRLTVEKILYGFWCGREPLYEFQDVVFGRKANP